LENEKLLGIRGSTILISALQNNGGSISSRVADVQGANNIEAEKTFRLYEFWIQQNLWRNKISILAGLYDINTEFDIMESVSLFMQSSQGLGGDFAGSGLVGPPTFPTAGLGGRIKYIPDRNIYLQAGLFDGVPVKSGSLNRAYFKWNTAGGTLATVEVALLYFDNNTFSRQEGLSTRKK